MNAARHEADRHAGFTLLELLVAIFVLGFVIVMSSQGFQFGLQATRLVAGEHKEDLLATDQALRRMIALADPGVYPEPATLRGTVDSLAMTTELPSGGAGPSQRADTVLSASDGQLVLRWRPHRHAEWFGSGPAWSNAVMAEGIERVEFAYLAPGGSAGWSSSWTGERLPSFIRLTIVFADHGGRRWPPIIAALVREPIEE